MQFTRTAVQLFMLFAAALPSVQGITIAVGNQRREGGTHFNIAWVEGTSACSRAVSIAPESERLCNQNFVLDGEKYYLVGCTDRDTGYAQNPQRLRREKDNALVATCSAVSKKRLNCSPHDVVKRYVCG